MGQSYDLQRPIPPARYKKGLILSANVCVGFQVASLLEPFETKVQVYHSAYQIYKQLEQEQWDVFIADINSVSLGGLATLMYCQKHFPAIATYAIVQKEDLHRKIYARDWAGCRGFFYLLKDKLEIDSHKGMAAALLGNQLSDKETKYQRYYI